MIVVTGEIELHPEDAWPAIFHAVRLMAASEAEDGCLCYRVYADLINPRRFRVYEEWRDESALEAHARSRHMIEFAERMREFRVLDRALKRMDVEESAPL